MPATLDTGTQFTVLQCRTCVYTYKLLEATGRLIEFELYTVKLFSL
jgi:hypothetical protein